MMESLENNDATEMRQERGWVHSGQKLRRKKGGKKQGGKKYKGTKKAYKKMTWYAQIVIRGTVKKIGTYRKEREAARAYDEVARKYSRTLNFQDRAGVAGVDPRQIECLCGGQLRVFAEKEEIWIECRDACKVSARETEGEQRKQEGDLQTSPMPKYPQTVRQLLRVAEENTETSTKTQKGNRVIRGPRHRHGKDSYAKFEDTTQVNQRRREEKEKREEEERKQEGRQERGTEKGKVKKHTTSLNNNDVTKNGQETKQRVEEERAKALERERIADGWFDYNQTGGEEKREIREKEEQGRRMVVHKHTHSPTIRTKTEENELRRDVGTDEREGVKHSENIRRMVKEIYGQNSENKKQGKGQHDAKEEGSVGKEEKRREGEQEKWSKQNKGVYNTEKRQENKRPEHRTGYLLPGTKIMQPRPNQQMMEIPTLNVLTMVHMFGYVWFPDYPEMQQTTAQADRREVGLRLLNTTHKQIWTVDEPAKMVRGLMGEIIEEIKEAQQADKAWAFLRGERDVKTRPSEKSFLNKEGDEITGEAIAVIDKMVDKVWKASRISMILREMVGILERQEIGQTGVNITLGEPRQEETLLNTWSVLKYGEQMWKVGEEMNLKKKLKENRDKKEKHDVHRGEIRSRLSRVLKKFSDQFEGETDYTGSDMYMIPGIWEEEQQKKRRKRTEMSVGEKRQKQDDIRQTKEEGWKEKQEVMQEDRQFEAKTREKLEKDTHLQHTELREYEKAKEKFTNGMPGQSIRKVAETAMKSLCKTVANITTAQPTSSMNPQQRSYAKILEEHTTEYEKAKAAAHVEWSFGMQQTAEAAMSALEWRIEFLIQQTGWPEKPGHERNGERGKKWPTEQEKGEGEEKGALDCEQMAELKEDKKGAKQKADAETKGTSREGRRRCNLRLLDMKPNEWINSPRKAQIAHNRKVASEMESRPIRFPTEADVGAQRNQVYRCEFGEYGE